jgi:sugar fermentation stimulation protein A
VRFEPPLARGQLLRRYKRFLADVRFPRGEVVVAHVPNTGAMTGCDSPGSPAWLSRHDDPRRKLRYTLELVESNGVPVVVNTSLANEVVDEALEHGVVAELDGYPERRREVRSGGSRLDFRLSGATGRPDCFVEVKSVTLVERGTAMFPDASTARGRRHLEELAAIAAGGARAVILFVVQREDGAEFRPAAHIDPDYAALLERSRELGVELLVYRSQVSSREVRLIESVPARL